MSHPETNRHFSKSSGRHWPSLGGNGPEQSEPTSPRSTQSRRSRMRNFGQDQTLGQHYEPQHVAQSEGPTGRVFQPRSRVLDPEEPPPTSSEVLPFPNHFPLHVGREPHLHSPPAQPEKQRSRGKSRSTVQFVPLPEKQDQPLPTKPQGNSPASLASNLVPELHDQDQRRHRPDLQLIRTQKTNLMTWCTAVFCMIFWIVVIIGGLIVLIVYLVFRPHIPQFDISAATLNAAYLDMDLLNADVTMLVNFTNPNKKVRVDFSVVILDLYYRTTPIATQYVEPFSALRSQTVLANVHMITSQVHLPAAASRGLSSELESNGLVLFEVKGLFRARSNLGSLLRYLYPLYSHCYIYLTGPPTGVLRASKCKTKR